MPHVRLQRKATLTRQPKIDRTRPDVERKDGLPLFCHVEGLERDRAMPPFELLLLLLLPLLLLLSTTAAAF